MGIRTRFTTAIVVGAAFLGLAAPGGRGDGTEPTARYAVHGTTYIVRWTTSFWFFLIFTQHHERRFSRNRSTLDVDVPAELAGASSWTPGMPLSVTVGSHGIDAATTTPRIGRRFVRLRGFQGRPRVELRWKGDSLRLRYRYGSRRYGGKPDLPESEIATVVVGDFARDYQFDMEKHGLSASAEDTGTPAAPLGAAR